MTPYQIQTLETLYRQAVKLQANPGGQVAMCEAACGRFGHHAHHVVNRSQEPGIRWKYEPRFGLWLCSQCHNEVHLSCEDILQRVRSRRVVTLQKYLALHDRIRCKLVTFAWMRSYLKRCIERLERNWSDAFDPAAQQWSFATNLPAGPCGDLFAVVDNRSAERLVWAWMTGKPDNPPVLY